MPEPFEERYLAPVTGTDIWYYCKRQIAPTCPSNEGLDKLVYGQDIRQVSGNDDDQGSN
jgi:hypothetical protein